MRLSVSMKNFAEQLFAADELVSEHNILENLINQAN